MLTVQITVTDENDAVVDSMELPCITYQEQGLSNPSRHVITLLTEPTPVELAKQETVQGGT